MMIVHYHNSQFIIHEHRKTKKNAMSNDSKRKNVKGMDKLDRVCECSFF